MDEDVEVVAEPGRTEKGTGKVRLVRERLMKCCGSGAGCRDELGPHLADDVRGGVDIGYDDVGDDLLAGAGDDAGRVDELDVAGLGPVALVAELTRVRPEVVSKVSGRRSTDREPVRLPRPVRPVIAGPLFQVFEN
ncbi:hypothetical protein GCM10022237_46220 [Nocardioides ginsengisoli]